MNIHVPQHNTTYKNITIKNASDLKYWHEVLNPNSLYFDRKTMKFFGDTMRNYGIKNHGDYIELYRKRAVKEGLNTSAYFCAKTFKRLITLEQ